MQDYKKLAVWEKSHLLAIATYKATKSFPRSETYGLTSQVRRACVSIPANIAEGCGRHGLGELMQFLHFAQGSASELEYHFLLAKELRYFDHEIFEFLNNQLAEVRRMLTAFLKKLNTSN